MDTITQTLIDELKPLLIKELGLRTEPRAPLTVAEFCKRIPLSKSTVTKMCNEGDIERVEGSPKILIPWRELVRLSGD